MGNYKSEYLEKYPKEFQTVMFGVYAFGYTEMQQIMKEALLRQKRF